MDPCGCPHDHRPTTAVDPHRPVGRRAVLAGGLAAAALPFVPGFARGAGAAPAAPAADPDLYYSPDLSTKTTRPMMFPIVAAAGSIDRLRNYGDNRGDHIHAGEDVGGPKLSKLLAVVSGTVVRKVFASSGNYLYLKGDDGWYYGYLHINNDTPGTDDGKNPPQWAFAPGIAEGVRVSRGQHIAYLGDSGNAEATIPHLHFEIRKPTDVWYHAQAVNPSYSLDAAAKAQEAPQVDPATFKPWDNAEDLVKQQSRDILGREATSGLATWSSKLNSGEVTPDKMIQTMLGQPGSSDVVAPLVRLYLSSFPRVPDAGLLYWIDRVRAGDSLNRVADVFANTKEFKERYGAMGNAEFVRAIYQPMFGRSVDQGGLDYWTAKLDAGVSRGRVVHGLAESAEYKTKTKAKVDVSMTYAAMLVRSPDPSGYTYWSGQVSASEDKLQTLIKTIRTGSEYATRIAQGGGRKAAVLPPGEQPASPTPSTTTAPAPTTTAATTTAPSTTAPPTTAAPTATAAPTTAAAPTTTAPSTTVAP